MIYTVTLNPSIDYVFKVERFEEGCLNHIFDEEALPGGKGLNVSRIMKELGTTSTNLGFLGGFTGSFIEDKLEEYQIAHDFVRIAHSTRINLKMKSATETELNGMGPTITSQERQQFMENINKIEAGDVVILSGSIPHSLSENFYEDIVSIVEAKGASFVVDTSGEKLWKLLAKKPLLVKPNRDELALLFNRKINSLTEIIECGQALLTKGAQHVIVSLGGEGSVYIGQTGIYKARPIKGQLVNSVGAGDSMVAGFIDTLIKTQNPLDAYRVAVACGTSTAFTQDLANLSQINEVLPSVSIKQVKE
ncbi:1-phosphofructokinase [Vagococcus zengguangii]|uniref:Tagatose-6-phosphate kinase n=1 Tax=Vagococcus zengguangii TaxID=2571750 RepID=A0A4D7CT17_9ENTE|nr:1-phosphofructokinase [Vagococcus zengguangii]QCI85596.1 1-phosphofructokinase [Vagococcus zengguangii]TLG79547.1 1-phosphofructokinase [Vagococcus zengguangii]